MGSKMERRLGEKRRLLSGLQRVVIGEGKLDVLGARIMADGWRLEGQVWAQDE